MFYHLFLCFSLIHSFYFWIIWLPSFSYLWPHLLPFLFMSCLKLFIEMMFAFSYFILYLWHFLWAIPCFILLVFFLPCHLSVWLMLTSCVSCSCFVCLSTLIFVHKSFCHYYTIIMKIGWLLTNSGLGLRYSGTEGLTWEPVQPVYQNKMQFRGCVVWFLLAVT